MYVYYCHILYLIRIYSHCAVTVMRSVYTIHMLYSGSPTVVAIIAYSGDDDDYRADRCGDISRACMMMGRYKSNSHVYGRLVLETYL